MKHTSTNESQTAQIAATLSETLKPRDVLCLNGTLGMGKTVFARALIRRLTNNPSAHIPSPTFTLLQTYDAPIAPIYHYDFYRIKDPDEIFELDWEDALADAITIIEWPQRLSIHLPQTRLDITLSNLEKKPDSRIITIERVK
jgi:tRNA threonylcarbamoyl adenosine modification protein YjeE